MLFSIIFSLSKDVPIILINAPGTPWPVQSATQKKISSLEFL